MLMTVQIPTGRAVIQVTTEAEPDNCIVLFKGANHSRETALPQNLADYSTLVLQNEIPLQHTIAAVLAAKAAGIATIFNPSPMLTKKEAATFPWSSVTWLVVNKDELSTLCSVLSSDLRGKSDDGLVALHEHLDKQVNLVVTLGKNGSSALLAGDIQPIHAPAGRLLRPVLDTVRTHCWFSIPNFAANISI